MAINNSVSLVFIAGLGHSGSTLLDLLLGAQPGVTGLGEIHVFLDSTKRKWHLKRYDKYPCTCGEKPSSCSVWGHFKKELEQEKGKSYSAYYKSIFDRAAKVTGSKVIVDSSKNIFALEKVYQSLDTLGLDRSRFFVLHLVKDVRSFTASSIRHRKEKSHTYKIFLKWKKKNEIIDRFIKKHNIQSMHVGYEELTLSLEVVLKKIASFINLNETEMVAELRKSKSHIISGNLMRLKQAEKIQYDYRWFFDPLSHLNYALMPSVRKRNQEWVYSNVQMPADKKSK